MGKHVLVIDDSKLVLTMVQEILETAHYTVSTAEDVVYCNDLIYCKSPPDLILMDINMPFMTGDHKVRILKSRPKSSHIPIILMSSIIASELRSIAENCGADGFLEKPVVDHVLLAKIDPFLRKDVV